MALRAPCLCRKVSTGLVDIYDVKRSQRHLLAAIENNRIVSPISIMIFFFTSQLANVKPLVGQIREKIAFFHSLMMEKPIRDVQ